MAVNTTSLAADRVFKQVQGSCRALRARCVSRLAAMAGGTFNANQLQELRADCLALAGEIQAAAQVPGIVDYAKSVEDDPDYDVAAEYSALRTLCLETETLINTLAGAVTDGNGYLLLWKIVPGQGDLDPRVFSAGATTSLQAKVQEIITCIIV